MDLRLYLKIVKEEEIARRYFVMNSFDGALTILGIVIAVYISGERNTTLIIISSLGAAIAMTVSGIWGAYSIERAERQRSLRELEMHLLSDLDETEIERKVNITTILVALVDGFSPLLVSIVTITPFLAVQIGLLALETAFYLSLSLIALVLIVLGAMVGKIAKENMIKSGLSMLFAGICVGVIVCLLDLLKVL